jgi:membrane protease subunit (stomatin/prohibitin family)
VIQFQDPTGEVMVARVPEEGTAEIVSGSQLIVQEGQIAVFFHDGKPTDRFRAGRYNLSTQNLPVLSKILNLATYGESPFRSYVYFIALKTFTNLGWGTPSPILFRDTEFRMVNLRAHGAFAVRVADPKVFLYTIVGTQGLETSAALQDYLRKIIVSRLAKVLSEVLTTVVDLAGHYDKISALVKRGIRDDFAQYGVELVDLVIQAITLPTEVQEAIDRAAGVRAVGREETPHYATVLQTDALLNAARQPGGEAAAGLTAGLGLGAGMREAREMMAQPAPLRAPPREAAQPTLDEIRLKLKDLKTLVDEGLITQDDFETQKRRLLDRL